MNEQEPKDLNVSHSHSHSSQPDSGLQYLKTSLVFRFIVVLVAMTAVATVVGVIALWPNNERSEEIQNNAEEIVLTSQLLKATVHEASESICGY